MRLKEFRDLEEVGHVPVKARDYMQGRRGYRLMDYGSDQFAYQMPRGSYVFKIFGGHKEAGDNPQLSPSQAMYLQWVQYCVDHAASNKFLPRFRRTHGRYWHERVVDGRLLIGTFQELLTKDDAKSLALSRFCDLLRNEKKLVLGIISGDIDPDTGYRDDEPSWTQRVARQINTVREQFTEADFQLWLDTVLFLQDQARAGGWGWDLHAANIMFRGPTPVILDPWHTWHETWDAVADMERIRNLRSGSGTPWSQKE